MLLILNFDLVAVASVRSDLMTNVCKYTIRYLNKFRKTFKVGNYSPLWHIVFLVFVFIYEPQHEISNNVVCATSEGSDQPVHTRSLIRAFACRLNIL